MIDSPPPEIRMELAVERGSIEVRGIARGSSRARFTLYAARRCSSRKRTVSARGRFIAGPFLARLAFSILPARRGRVCYRLRSRDGVVAASRRYRVPAPAGR